MKLKACLEQTPFRMLYAIARVQGVSVSHMMPKSQLVCTLRQHLLAAIRHPLWPNSLQSVSHALLLSQNGDHAPVDLMSPFRQIRIYQPWKTNGNFKPWSAELTIAERLVYSGYAYLLPTHCERNRRIVEVVVVPDEIRERLKKANAPCLANVPMAPPSAPVNLAERVGFFLIALQARPAPLLRDRWLTPHAVRFLLDWLGLSAPHGFARSERDYPTLSLIHFLARQAGLLTVRDSQLAPTLIAREWLSRSGTDRLHCLWNTLMTSTNEEEWQAHRLAGWEHPTPLRLAREMVNACRVNGHSGCQDVAAFADIVLELHPDLQLCALAAQLDPPLEGDPHLAIRALLTRPLRDLGLVTLSSDGLSFQAHIDSIPPDEHSQIPNLKPVLSEVEASQIPSPKLVLSPSAPLHPRRALHAPRKAGAGTWINSAEGSKIKNQKSEIAPRPSPLTWLSETELLIPAQPDWPTLLLLADFMDCDVRDGARRLRLTQSHLVEALRAGLSLAAICERLEHATGQPVPTPMSALLRAWADAHEEVRLREVLILETGKQETLTKLCHDRAVRSNIGQTLSSRAVVIEHDRLPALERRLAKLGYLTNTRAKHMQDNAHASPLQSADGHLLLAALTYTQLGDIITMPAALPPNLIDELTAHLSPAERACAERLAAQVAEELKNSPPPQPLPRPTGEGQEEGANSDLIPIPAERWLPRLERAIERGESIEIEYQGGKREGRTLRRVEPYRIEKRRRLHYLVAYCYLRRGERCFRVDRILRMQ